MSIAAKTRRRWASLRSRARLPPPEGADDDPQDQAGQDPGDHVAQAPVGIGAHRARRDHGQERTALGGVLAEARQQHHGHHHDGAAADAHHAGEKAGEHPGRQQGHDLAPAGDVVGQKSEVVQVGFAQQQERDDRSRRCRRPV